jgi:hypothetical protein
MNRRVPLAACQRRLAVALYAGAAPVFLVVFVQTLRDVYGERTQEVWAWLLPTILPTLLLITGVVAAQALRPRDPHAPTVDRFFYRLTLGITIAYLLLVNAVFFLRPFSPLSPLGLLQRASLFLGPLQGLLDAALGVFFSSPKAEK